MKNMINERDGKLNITTVGERLKEDEWKADGNKNIWLEGITVIM